MEPVVSMLRRVRRPAKTRRAGLSAIKPLPEEERSLIPEADFVSEKFDRVTSMPASRMLIVLSTPRSGSTYLCQLLHRAEVCTAHEYFQHYQYLPILAQRWGCIEDGQIHWDKYVSALERHRTSGAGVLGINLHGSHLWRFAAALPHFSAKDVKYVWLQRQDKLKQAVSLGIAEQTHQWSSQFEKRRSAEYDFEFFKRRVEIIHEQETLIHAFLAVGSLKCDIIYYEDFTRNPRAVLEPLFGRNLSDALAPHEQELRPQRSSVNDEIARHLAADLFHWPSS